MRRTYLHVIDNILGKHLVESYTRSSKVGHVKNTKLCGTLTSKLKRLTIQILMPLLTGEKHNAT